MGIVEQRETRLRADAARRSGEVGWPGRRRLERLLHDGPALRLAALSVRLGACCEQAPDNRALKACIARAQDELHTALQELREVANQIYPPVLASAGLGAALEALAERHDMPVTVDVPEERYGASVEADAYFAVADRLLPLADQASAITVMARRDDSDLLFGITVEETGGSAITVRIPCG